MQLAAIWAGVTGTLSDLPTVSPAPVTAQVMKTELMLRSDLSYLMRDWWT